MSSQVSAKKRSSREIESSSSSSSSSSASASQPDAVDLDDGDDEHEEKMSSLQSSASKAKQILKFLSTKYVRLNADVQFETFNVPESELMFMNILANTISNSQSLNHSQPILISDWYVESSEINRWRIRSTKLVRSCACI